MELELTNEQIELHDRLYREGWETIDGEIQVHGRAPLGKPSWSARRKLKKAISLFERTLQINPSNWASMWALGKIHQRTGSDATALEWLTKAHQIKPTNPDVLREAALCALNLGKPKEAVAFTTMAIALKPDDPGLVANLALALLLDHKPEEAKEKAKEAVTATSNDAVSRNVLRFIDDVISEERPYPKSFRDVR